MTDINEIIIKCDLTAVVECDFSRNICGVYCGDLLSWVMSHAKSDFCLVTIMSNINVLAVASLLDLSCVILAESVKADDEFIKIAKEKNINVLSSNDTSFEICAKLYEAMK